MIAPGDLRRQVRILFPWWSAVTLSKFTVRPTWIIFVTTSTTNKQSSRAVINRPAIHNMYIDWNPKICTAVAPPNDGEILSSRLSVLVFTLQLELEVALQAAADRNLRRWKRRWIMGLETCRSVYYCRGKKIQIIDHRKIRMRKDHHLKQGIYFLLLALAADISVNRCVERMW